MAIFMPKTLILLSFLLLATICLAEDEKYNPAKDEKYNKDRVMAAEKTMPPKIDCGAACKARCRLSSRPNLCKRACGTCCARCNCVPPGTSGNQNVCPCYANMTTHGGRRKCP